MKKSFIYLFLVCAISMIIIGQANTYEIEGSFSNSYLNKNHDGSIFDERFEEARSKIINIMKEIGVPSISVAVAKDGRIIWEEAFGWANREERIKATPHTMYSLASISKPITATGLMILLERGLIDLNLPANNYLGPAKLVGYEGKASDATVSRILHHTSGLPLHWNFFFENEPYRRPSMDETIRRYGILVAEPGEVYQYSNLGYGILDYIISRVSGKSYEEFMKAEVFVPLGMTHTSIQIGPGLEDYAAQRYSPEQTPYAFYDFDHRGASAVFSSAHDLVQFGMFHLKNHLSNQEVILKDETIERMQQEVDPKLPDMLYRLGWRVEDNDYGYRSVSHKGGMEGVSTSLKLIPSENLAVVVLCNGRHGKIYELENEIIAALLPKFARNFMAKEKKSKDKKPERFSPPSSILGNWTGKIKTYSGIMPIEFVFQNDGDVHVKIKNQFETLLNNVSFKDQFLTGNSYGEIETEDARRNPHKLYFVMKLRGKRLSGYVCAVPAGGLSSYIYLERKSKDKKN